LQLLVLLQRLHDPLPSATRPVVILSEAKNPLLCLPAGHGITLCKEKHNNVILSAAK
jgi:hypothetical protein